MKKLNKVFVILFAILWIATFITRLFLDKGQFLTAVGLNRSTLWNSFFIISTQFAEEFAYMLFAVVFLFIRYRISLAIAFTGIVVTIVAGVLKVIFALERPYIYFKNLGLEDGYALIDGVEPYQGLTSFPSGHAMAGFALMSLLSIYVRNSVISILFLAVAIIVGLSRIYLGHHFLEDVLFGSILGVIISYLVDYLISLWKAPILDQSMLSSRRTKINA